MPVQEVFAQNHQSRIVIMLEFEKYRLIESFKTKYTLIILYTHYTVVPKLNFTLREV